MRALATACVVSWMIAAGLPALSGDVVTGLKGLDPVALSEGREKAGLETLSAVHAGFRYQFENEENRRRFLGAPDRYSIQFGGACMKMGPLSGKGSPDRWAVHEGRIYVFASDSCRESFKADPLMFIDREDPRPPSAPGAKAKADEVLLRAVEAVGGDKALEGLTAIRRRVRATYPQGDKTVEAAQTYTRAYPDGCRFDESWGKASYGWMLTGEGGYMIDDAQVTPVEASVRAYMDRECQRDPLTLLKAWKSARADAVTAGTVKTPQRELDLVTVSLRGASTTLGVDRATGRIVQASYRGRATRGIGDVVREYSDFRTVGGLLLPYEARTTQDRKLVESPSLKTESIEVNPALDPSVFRAPQGAAGGADPVEALGWLSGCWAGEVSGRGYEEQWMRPAGGVMLGMSRTLFEGRAVEHEFLEIRMTDGAVSYVAHPSGQAGAAFALVTSSESQAVFENPTHDFPRRIEYRLDKDGKLTATIEGPADAGKTRRAEYALQHVPCL